MEILFESASVFCTVSGKEERERHGETKLYNNTYPVVLDAAQFDKIGAYRNSVDVPANISKRYQSVRIVDYQTIVEDGVTYKHMALLFIVREKQKFQVTKIAQSPRVIAIGNDEFQCFDLFVTIVPGTNTMIVDRRANLGPLSFVFKKALLDHLLPKNYGLANLDELEAGTRVAIRQNLKRDFEARLNANYKKMKKISVTLAKPVAVRRRKRLKTSEDKQGLALVKDAIKSILGTGAVKAKFLDLPIKKFEIGIVLSEQMKPAAMKTTKNNILKYVENDLVTATSVEFDSDEDHIQNAVLSGLRETRKYEIPATQAEDKAAMWVRQRALYSEVVGEE